MLVGFDIRNTAGKPADTTAGNAAELQRRHAARLCGACGSRATTTVWHSRLCGACAEATLSKMKATK